MTDYGYVALGRALGLNFTEDRMDRLLKKRTNVSLRSFGTEIITTEYSDGNMKLVLEVHNGQTFVYVRFVDWDDLYPKAEIFENEVIVDFGKISPKTKIDEAALHAKTAQMWNFIEKTHNLWENA